MSRIGCLIITGAASIVFASCAENAPLSPESSRGSASDAVKYVEQLKQVEKVDPGKAAAAYREFLATPPDIAFDYEYYRNALASSLQDLQNNRRTGTFSSEAGLGFPEVFTRALMARVGAHQGLARTLKATGSLDEAASQALEAIDLVRKKAIVPSSRDESVYESQRLLQTIREAQGQKGKALVARLSADLVRDHMQSKKGVDAYYAEKAAVLGGKTKQDFASAQSFVKGVYDERAAVERAQSAEAVALATAFNAQFQARNAQAALERNGGVMTPEIQRMQMNATMAQFQSQIFATMAREAASEVVKLQANETPWASPSFVDQLTDPDAGVRPVEIIETFSDEATTTFPQRDIQESARKLNTALISLEHVQSALQKGDMNSRVTEFGNAFTGLLKLVSAH